MLLVSLALAAFQKFMVTKLKWLTLLLLTEYQRVGTLLDYVDGADVQYMQ